MNKKELLDFINDKVAKVFGITLAEANRKQLYNVAALVVNDLLLDVRGKFDKAVKEQKAKRVYYLSMEFLLGRSLKNNIHNLALEKQFAEIFSDLDYTLEEIYLEEPDAGLGNGGLGRLGVCYLDALASQQYPAYGYSLRYDYGLFKQVIKDGWQVEYPDCWLPGGAVWLNERHDKIYSVKYGGKVIENYTDGKVTYEYQDYEEFFAIASDFMISGADSESVSVLRLWESKSLCSFDINSFSKGDYTKAMKSLNRANIITKVLYPTDDHPQGKGLRLMQQYLLASASIQDIVSDYLVSYKDIKDFGKYVAIHINDTHPTLAIIELMRLLIDDFGLSFDESWKIINETFAYTNHTIMMEALERWPVDLLRSTLPRVFMIIEQINARFIEQAKDFGFDDYEINHLSIINNNQVVMANLCVIAAYNVNGVSKLHSNIIANTLFKGYNQMYPEKFMNVTNGIAYRRWLNQSNKHLSAFLDDLIGNSYYKNAQDLEKLLDYQDDQEVLAKLAEIKYQNKVLFAKSLYEEKGIVIDPNTRFDVQVKRIHEYKRQLINALKVVYLVTELEKNPELDMTPQTFIFGGKAAPGYYAAKEVIELIVNLGKEIDNNPVLSSKLKVIFLEDYNVSLAETLFPASDVSQQISLAGKEASGTGNMKFMINGAITLGTLDGANVEIFEAVGKENIFIFGMTAKEVYLLRKSGYRPIDLVEQSPKIAAVIDRLNKGFNNKQFDNITRYLLTNYNPDPFMTLADFEAYVHAHEKMDEMYADQLAWNKMALINIAKAGIFAADRSVEEYCEKIWDLKKVQV